MSKKIINHIPFILLLINVLVVILYFSYFRFLVYEAYEGKAPIWFNTVIEVLYPRFFVEKQRFDFGFFLNKTDQIILRLTFVLLLIEGYLFLKSRFYSIELKSSRFWNKQTSFENITALRILYFALLIFIFIDIYPDMLSLSKASAFYKPIPLFRVLHLSFPSNSWILIMYIAFIGSCLLCILNLFTIPSSIIAVSCFIYFQGIIFGFEKTDHGFALMTYAGMILPFLLYEFRRDKKAGRTSVQSWPLTLIQILIAGGYFFSGLEKLFISHLEWITSSTLKQYLLLHGQEAGLALASNDVLTLLLALFTILFEVGFILILFFEKLKYFFLPAGILFHAGVWYFLGVAGILHPWVFAYIFFIDWTKALQMVKARLPLKKVS